MADLQQEHHREIEGLLENIRQLSRELRLQMLIIDNFIPQEYQVWLSTYIRRFFYSDFAKYPWLVLFPRISTHKEEEWKEIRNLPWLLIYF